MPPKTVATNTTSILCRSFTVILSQILGEIRSGRRKRKRCGNFQTETLCIRCAQSRFPPPFANARGNSCPVRVMHGSDASGRPKVALLFTFSLRLPPLACDSSHFPKAEARKFQISLRFASSKRVFLPLQMALFMQADIQRKESASMGTTNFRPVASANQRHSQRILLTVPC
jgi:hypothetical protein